MIQEKEFERHWSPNQDYATGDILVNFLKHGWMVSNCDSEKVGPAQLFKMELGKGEEQITIRILDSPIVRRIAKEMEN